MRPFRYYLRVRYSECDAQKVVFNGRYGEYVDLAVTEYMRAIGLTSGGLFVEFDYQLVKQTIEWRAPARFDDVFEISVQAKHLRTTSFTILVEFRIAGNESLTTTVETVYVNVDPKSLAKQPLPESTRNALTRGAPEVQIDHAGYLTPGQKRN